MPAEDKREVRKAGTSLTLSLAAVAAAAVAVIMAAAALWAGHPADASPAGATAAVAADGNAIHGGHWVGRARATIGRQGWEAAPAHGSRM